MIVYILTYLNANDDYYSYIWGVFDTRFLAESQKRIIKILNKDHIINDIETFEVVSAN
ncbi:hypothetical protein LCGC14_1094430 [marine sediment metagenome]|uniref:Uncharacterized protein n=1 Tax=marine sediment metagenome TaxID=412755 RepID=A0A0F9MFR0_9ZZZZ